MSFVAECDQCGVIERGDFEAVGDAVEDHEQFHDVHVSRVATDGGRSIEEVNEDGHDEWCDWCQAEFYHGPTWKVEGTHITGYFCRRACAEQWKSAAGEVERIDQPRTATDGGTRIDDGSKYVNETGENYVGTHAARQGDLAINAVTAGITRGTRLYAVEDGERALRLTREEPDDDTVLIEKRRVSDGGYVYLTTACIEHLETFGEDVRMYDVDGDLQLVPADDDPHLTGGCDE